MLRRVDGEPIYAVEAVTEKPDEARARAYTESGRYLWNSNMFAWKARTVLDLFARFEPEIYDGLMRIRDMSANDVPISSNERRIGVSTRAAR